MLSQKVCIVAGGGHGLGKATAQELAGLGASVVVNDLGSGVHGEGSSESPAEQVAQSIREEGGEAMAHFGDIASLDYTESLVEDTVEQYGRVDGAVNFAGILRDSICYKMSGEEWDQVIRVHLRGHFALLRNLGAHWRSVASQEDDRLNTQRSFLAVSSRSALGNVGQVNYSAAKAGVLGLTRTAARELDRFNIRVNALMPTAYTRMIDDMPEEHRPFERSEMPPERVAPLIGFLMSDRAEDITGCTLRAANDHVGLYSDPQLTRLAYREGGWSAEQIAASFRDAVGPGEELHRTGGFA